MDEDPADEAVATDTRGTAVLSIGTERYDLTVTDCQLRSSVAGDEGRATVMLGGITGEESFNLNLRFDPDNGDGASAALLEFSTEANWVWSSTNVNARPRGNSSYLIEVAGKEFDVRTGTNGDLVPEEEFVPSTEYPVVLAAASQVSKEVDEPLVPMQLEAETTCTILWSLG